MGRGHNNVAGAKLQITKQTQITAIIRNYTSKTQRCWNLKKIWCRLELENKTRMGYYSSRFKKCYVITWVVMMIRVSLKGFMFTLLSNAKPKAIFLMWWINQESVVTHSPYQTTILLSVRSPSLCVRCIVSFSLTVLLWFYFILFVMLTSYIIGFTAYNHYEYLYVRLSHIITITYLLTYLLTYLYSESPGFLNCDFWI